MRKFIVIDGLDGSGKTTQFEIIKNILNKNHNLTAISFPDYNKPSSALVRMYLSGQIATNAKEINAYAASSFYAVDRYASYKLYWEKDYLNNNIILASRYVSSNAIHQMSKLPENQWDNYLSWLDDYEHNKLGLPRPDCVIFLDMPIEVSQKLMTSRYDGNESKKDIHESNIAYLQTCRKTALYAAAKNNWYIVNCSDGKNAYDIHSITEQILKIIN